jgi:hypothetical protein
VRAEVAQGLGAVGDDESGDERQAVTGGRAGDELRGLGGGGGLFEGGEFFGLLGFLGEEGREALLKLGERRADFLGEGVEAGLLGGDVVVGGDLMGSGRGLWINS